MNFHNSRLPWSLYAQLHVTGCQQRTKPGILAVGQRNDMHVPLVRGLYRAHEVVSPGGTVDTK
jgi:hypothetical protein